MAKPSLPFTNSKNQICSVDACDRITVAVGLCDAHYRRVRKNGSTEATPIRPAKTHCKSFTAEYHIWAGIKQRCLNPKTVGFHRYGGRGITVCDRWLASFQNFIDDMGARPSAEYSIERIDNDGNYEPTNCKWATKAEQTANKTQRQSEQYLTWDGVTRSFIEWAQLRGCATSTIRKRVEKGWCASCAITLPNGKQQTCSHNQSSQQKTRKKYLGVRHRPDFNRSPFHAVIKHNGKTIHIGSFATPEEAARAYDAKSIELRGESAIVNFPESVRSYRTEV